MISLILPPCFYGNSLSAVRAVDSDANMLLPFNVQAFLCALWNSFAVDYMVRSKVSANVNFFYVYQVPILRLTPEDAGFTPIVERAGRLICSTPGFDGLALNSDYPATKTAQRTQPNEPTCAPNSMASSAISTASRRRSSPTF
jgi:hypothetical protein